MTDFLVNLHSAAHIILLSVAEQLDKKKYVSAVIMHFTNLEVGQSKISAQKR
jgi:hypothetical protein